MSLRTQKIILIAQELAKSGQISQEQLQQALEAKDIAQFLVKQSLITGKDLNDRLATKAGITAVSLANFNPDAALLKTIQPDQAKRWKIFPHQEKSGKLVVATSDPFNLAVLDEARSELGRELDCVLASQEEIEASILLHYGKTNKSTATVSSETVEIVSYQTPTLESASAANQIVSSVDQLLQAALQERASDIHLEPTREGLKVRFRIDGVLEQHQTLPRDMQEAILSRIKIMASMDVAEHRVTQDGRTRIRIAGKESDIRIAIYPTMYGEAAALRILSKSDLISLDSLGFLGKDRDIFEKLIHQPHGILLVTGPTGSGKTTTLYAALQKIDRNKSHVLSVEDPIENEIEGVDQTQINPKVGITFPTALRAMLRQDPDVIMVGEIRDQETAEISVGAAMTGHLVLSTLHTNTAIGAIARLNDLGVESYLIAATLLGVVSQRLVRRICQFCKRPAPIAPNSLIALGPYADNLQAYQGTGCAECEGRGLKGRIGIFELVEVDDEFRILINNHAPDVRLKEKSAAAGFHSILEDGIKKISQGLTTVEEVLKVCGID